MMQLIAKISIRTKGDEVLTESGELYFSGAVVGKDSSEITSRVKLLEKMCEKEGLEVWFTETD